MPRPPSLRGAKATKQSILPCGTMDCFASLANDDCRRGMAFPLSSLFSCAIAHKAGTTGDGWVRNTLARPPTPQYYGPIPAPRATPMVLRNVLALLPILIYLPELASKNAQDERCWNDRSPTRVEAAIKAGSTEKNISTPSGGSPTCFLVAADGLFRRARSSCSGDRAGAAGQDHRASRAGRRPPPRIALAERNGATQARLPSSKAPPAVVRRLAGNDDYCGWRGPVADGIGAADAGGSGRARAKPKANRHLLAISGALVADRGRHRCLAQAAIIRPSASGLVSNPGGARMSAGRLCHPAEGRPRPIRISRSKLESAVDLPADLRQQLLRSAHRRGCGRGLLSRPRPPHLFEGNPATLSPRPAAGANREMSARTRLRRRAPFRRLGSRSTASLNEAALLGLCEGAKIRGRRLASARPNCRSPSIEVIRPVDAKPARRRAVLIPCRGRRN